MLTTILGVFEGVLVGIFIASICSANRYSDIVTENRILTNKLVEIYRIKDMQNEN
jgi:hypothetical protein